MKHCRTLRLGAERRAAFLRLADLDESDRPLIDRLHERVIAPHVDAIIEAFYAGLEQLPDFMGVIAEARVELASLKRTQRDYLQSLGVDFARARYFEERLRIGAAHARVGVPLSLYVGSYRLLEQLLIDQVNRIEAEAAERERLTVLILKLAMLDMSLAIETYHGTKLGELRRSVDTLEVERARLRRDLWTDALTRVNSRRHVLDVLDESLAEARRKRRPLAIVMVDLDHFKSINDRHGHQIGDLVLHGVAGRLRTSVRALDTVGRFGGEEFLIVLPQADAELGMDIAERIRARIAGTSFKLRDVTIPVTVSEGVAVLDRTQDRDRLIEQADHALYAAKRAGRDCVRLYIAAHRGKRRGAARGAKSTVPAGSRPSRR